MTGKERILAAFAGESVDRMPVTVPYTGLYFADHFSELTGLPEWHIHKWRWNQPEEDVAILREMLTKTPFEFHMLSGGAREAERKNIEFIEKDGAVFCFNREKNTQEKLEPTASGHASDYAANETRHVFDKKDVDQRTKYQEIVDEGQFDYPRAVIQELGDKVCLEWGHMVGVVYGAHQLVGLTNLYLMMNEEPEFLDYICRRLCDNFLKDIEFKASLGAPVIGIDDAMTTCDMISPEHFECFSMPYLTEIVSEIHRHGCKSYLIYFGGVMDRLEQIASIGADAVLVECSMKNYKNDMAEIAQRIGDKVSLFGNIDPVGVLEKGTDEELENEINRQAEAGKSARGFIMSTGSPITPGTPLSRAQKFIELAKKS